MPNNHDRYDSSDSERCVYGNSDTDTDTEVTARKPRASSASRRPTRERLIEAIHKNLGNLTAVAASLGASRSVVYTWVEDYKLWPEVSQARESLLDLAESKLAEKLQDGDARLIEFALRTLGRIRGYSDNNMEHSGQVRVVVSYENPTD